MIRSLYSAVAGMQNHQTRMDVIANNISNVNTTAFKAGRVTFKDILSQKIGVGQVGSGMMLSSVDNNYNQGGLMNTGIATDLLIQGNGFFVVQDPNDTSGALYYTRDGSFHVDDAGNLVNSSGYQVCDNSGSPIEGITVPIESITIDRSGKISIFADGSTTAETYQIGLAGVNDLQRLVKKGENLYQYDMSPTTNVPSPTEPTIAKPGENGLGSIESTYLEMSNVDLTTEFTNMITTQRGYQANARAITTSDEMLQEIMSLKR